MSPCGSVGGRTASAFVSTLSPSNSLLCVEHSDLSLVSWTRVYKLPRIASSKAGVCDPLSPSSFILRAFALADRFGDEPCRASLVSLVRGLFRVLFTLFF